jgi:hypothetical protein
MDDETMFVEINYEGDSRVIIEGVGPHSVVGFVKDAVFGHFTEAPSGKKVVSILIGHRVEFKPGPHVVLEGADDVPAVRR